MFGDMVTPAKPDVATTSNRGLVSVQSADELLQQDQDAIKEAEDEQSQPVILSLAAHIKKVWQDHKTAKEQDIEPRLLKCLRLRKGVYDSQTKANITAQGGTDVFIKLTKTKCRAAKSWMKDIFLSQEKPFAITPTPIPELSEDNEQKIVAEVSVKYQESIMIHQQAGVDFDEKAFEEQAERYRRDVLQAMKDQAQAENEELENEIHDDLTEDGFYQALNALLWDITTFPACILKGPITRMKRVLEWDEEGQPVVNEIPKKHWERLSPFDVYPSRTAKTIQDGDLIERHRLSRQALHDLIGVEGYGEEAIRSVLASHDAGGLKLWLANDQERQQLENKPLEMGRSELIDALQFWGSVPGSQLIEWGAEEEGLNPTDQYSIESWLVGDVVISAMLNPDPLGKRPYYSGSYDDNPDSIWGEGVPELMDDIQKICNSFARAMVNNSGIACLTGDTIVYRANHNGRGYSEITLNELWAKKEVHNSGLRRIKLRSLDESEGIFFLNRIVDIFDNGRAPVYEVLTKHGYRIRATDNHRFMNDFGEWAELSSFTEGDMIAVNGRKTPLSPWNQRQVEASRENKNCSETTARQRKDCLDARKNYCEQCGARNVKTEVHHKDRDPRNNKPENLISLCEICHKYEHKRHDNFGNPYKHKYLDYDEIIRIQYVGVEQVFDLGMEGPNHNFVANGFVSHNSGPQVSVLTDLLQPGMDIETMYPWKIWQFKAEQFANGRMPIEFFQPNMILEPLQRAYDYFFKQASEVTGIPAYIYGSEKVGGAGRALANYEKVLTPQGPVDISFLKVDDPVVNSYGSSSKVTGVHPQGESDIFRLKFSNGSHVDCDMEHRWLARTHHGRKFRVLTTEEILDAGLFRKTKKDYKNPSGFRPKWMLPLIDFVEFEKREIKIDPYTMGALIGNGDARCRLCCRDQEIFDRIPYPLGKIDNIEDNAAWTHTIKGIKLDYLSYGLKCKSIEKFIPEDYLFNSKEIRLELLRGLMDTDGCCPVDGGTFYATSSSRLANDFRALVESLGATVKSISEEDGGEFEIRGKKSIRQKAYRIKFNLPGEKIFHLARKQDRTKDRLKTHTYITGIEYIGTHAATCITVDSDDHLFLCANFIPTHNTATGLSMLMNAANKGLKDVVGNLDKGVIQPAVRAYWQHIMLFEPDKAKGDINIVARASQYLMMMETLQVRRMEFLNFTNNPVDNQIIGPAGRAEVLRETAKSLQLPVDRIIPDKQSIIDSAQEAKIQIMIQNIAKALGAQPDQIMQMASGQQQQGGGGQPTQAGPRTLNVAGQPMG